MENIFMHMAKKAMFVPMSARKVKTRRNGALIAPFLLDRMNFSLLRRAGVEFVRGSF
jgi:hypothetical protein